MVSQSIMKTSVAWVHPAPMIDQSWDGWRDGLGDEALHHEMALKEELQRLCDHIREMSEKLQWEKEQGRKGAPDMQ